MSPRLADIIEHHYIRHKLRLHEKPIYFAIGFRFSRFSYDNTTHYHTDTSRNKIISLWDSDEVSAFKQFCHIFTDISFAVRMLGNSESQEFFKFVDNNCKAATKRIIIHSVNYEALSS